MFESEQGDEMGIFHSNATATDCSVLTLSVRDFFTCINIYMKVWIYFPALIVCVRQADIKYLDAMRQVLLFVFTLSFLLEKEIGGTIFVSQSIWGFWNLGEAVLKHIK